jgi:hypothetical protein
MDETLSIDDFDASTSEELIEEPERGLIRRASLTTSTPDEPKRKKKRLNEELWSHTRPAKDYEPARNKHSQEIYYCRHCTKYSTPASIRFRKHLRDEHGIRVQPTQETISQTAFKNAVTDIFGVQADQRDRNGEHQKHLRAAIQEPELKRLARDSSVFETFLTPYSIGLNFGALSYQLIIRLKIH